MTTSTDIDQLYREGVAAIRAGDKETGQEKLTKVVGLDQLHEQAWLWLSACVDTDEERILCLQNVLTINPRNESARRGLSKLGAPAAESEAMPKAPPQPAPSTPQPEPSPADALAPDEQWRAGLAEKYTSDAGYVSDATLVPSVTEASPRTLLDLASAWANALIFRVAGPYEAELSYGSVPHILVNIGAAVLLQVLAAVLLVTILFVIGHDPHSLLAQAVSSLNQMLAKAEQFDSAGLIAPPFRPVYNYMIAASGGGSMPRISPDVATAFGAIFVGYLILTILFTFVGQMMQAFVINAVAEWLGGKGEIIQLTLGLTTGLVATSIVQLPLYAMVPFSSTALIAASSGIGIYQFLQMANAVRASHKLNILVSIGVVILADILMVFLLGCFLGAVSFIGGL